MFIRTIVKKKASQKYHCKGNPKCCKLVSVLQKIKQFQKYQQHQEQGINDELYVYSYLNKSRVVTTGANFIFTDTESSVTFLPDFFKYLQNLEITLYSNSGRKITLKHVIMSSDLAEINLTEDDV